MERISIFDRILLLLTGFLAAYQIAIGIDQFSQIPILAYTIGFGILMIAGLLIFILGFEALDIPVVVILSSAIPFSLSFGLVWDHLPSLRFEYLAFIVLGFLAIMTTRIVVMKNSFPLIVLAIFHGVSGLILFILPMVLVLRGQAELIFSLVSLGGALIGIGGILLAMLRAGKAPLRRQTIFRILPILLVSMTAAFVLGFSAL